LKIATKLTLFFSGVVVLFVFLAVALLAQINKVSNGYDALLSQPVHQMEMARIVQVTFKKQVQEWKDILLRGHTPEDLAKYTKQFHDREADVRAGAAALADTMQDAEARELLQQFLDAHKVLGDKYETAYNVYVTGNFDFKAADKIVRGQDRAPTDLFDKVVKQLESKVKISVNAQQAEVAKNRNLALGLFGGMLVVLGLVGFVTVRSILQRLSRLKAVSDRLARADVEGLAVDISGTDEIGEFGESMKGVHAAIEELQGMAVAAAR